MGVTIDEVVVGDEPAAWEQAGFTVDPDGVCRVGTVRVRLTGRGDGKRIRSWALRDVSGDSVVSSGLLDGLPTTVSAAPPPEPAAHPNGSRLIDHLVIMSPDVDRTIAAVEAAGMPALRTRHVDAEQYGFAARQTFFRLGEVILELIGPDQTMSTDPARFFGLAVTVDDLDATQRLLGDHLPNVKDAVQPGRRIATLRHKELDMSVAIAFMSPGDGAV